MKDTTVKDMLQELAAYNVWATQKLIDVIFSLTPELQSREVISSFSGLQQTLMHIWYAESIWWQRLKLQEVIVPPGHENITYGEIAAGVLNQSALWNEWVDKSTIAALEHEFVYRNTKKEQFKQPVYQMLLHIFNHGTYHRGQLVTMLRQLNTENIPATDFILYSRTKKQ